MSDIRPAAFIATLLMACSAPPEPPAARSVSADTAATLATITFSADWTQSSTPLVAGASAQIAYAPARLPTCRGNAGGGTGPGWSIDGFASINGLSLAQPIPILGASLANEHLPPGTLPSFTPPFAGTLQLWFENTDVFGCNAWDSAYGANYAFAVAPPANAPGWMSGASVLIDRATCPGPCYADARSADGGATFDTWARQQAAFTELFFDVWKSGVTDFPNPDLWKELDVESHTRLDPSQPFAMSYVDFVANTGNNARYAVDLRAIDPLPGLNGGPLTNASQCPAIPATVTADGQYVQIDMQAYFTINGVALQPSGGGPFHVLFQNYAGLYAVCSYPHVT